MYLWGKKIQIDSGLGFVQLQFDNKYFVFFLCLFTAAGSDSELRSAFGCRKLIREMLHGPEVWICRLLFNSCISLCCQEGASVRDALWSLLHYYLVLWLRKTGEKNQTANL